MPPGRLWQPGMARERRRARLRKILQRGLCISRTRRPISCWAILPVGVTIDPRGKFLYVANFSSNTVGAYAIDVASGTPVGSVGSASTSVDTAPTCVTIEPALGIYAYTSNNLASTVSAMKLDPHNGGLSQVQNTPFPSSGLPTCAVSVANGSHPTQIIVE